jgi:shikimate 5-dehydrogenase
MTPYINECLIDCELQPHTLAVEFVHNPIQTKFLSLANESGCEVISGKEIFEAQFLMQHKLWKVSSHCCLHC